MWKVFTRPKHPKLCPSRLVRPSIVRAAATSKQTASERAGATPCHWKPWRLMSWLLQSLDSNLVSMAFPILTQVFHRNVLPTKHGSTWNFAKVPSGRGLVPEEAEGPRPLGSHTITIRASGYLILGSL
ncbi:unnamed protein product [Symbiodinium sp. CCMP2592]|nr:unnamed protein product [Symbiodinium sp. CCMP2592]